MQGNEINETHIQNWMDEIEIEKWLNELLENATRDSVSTLHFEISKHAGRIRQRKSSVMSMVADNISHQDFNRFIVAIKSRFNIDPTEFRRAQDGMDELGLRAAFIPTDHGMHCCINFDFQHENHESWLKFESTDANQILSTFEKRRGLVFVSPKRLSSIESIIANWQILKQMTTVFDGGKVLFAPWSIEKIITVPQVLYAMPLKNKSRRREWFEGLLLQQPDALFLPYGQSWPTPELCRYAEEHLVVVEAYSPSFFYDMTVPSSWIRKHCAGLLMFDTYHRICQSCRRSYIPSQGELQELKLKSTQAVEFSRGEGCEACEGKGIKGKQMSVTLAADGTSMASIFENTSDPHSEFWKTTSPAIRQRKAQLVKAGLIASYPSLHPEYWFEEDFDLDKPT